MINVIDLNVLNFFYNLSNKQFYFLNQLMIFFTFLGDDGNIFILLSIILLFFKKTRTLGMLMSVSLLLTLIISGSLKHIFHRPRPFEYFPNLNILINKPSSSSFPSGHASASFAAFGVFLFTKNKYKLLVFIIALLISLSRLYLCVHYLSDVVFGSFLGLFIALIVIQFYNKMIKNNTNSNF